MTVAIKKMAILRLTPEAMRCLMQLPEGVEVVRVELEPGSRGVLQLMIEGAGWDTPEGNAVMPARPAIVTQHFDKDGALASSTIDWGIPG